MSRDWPAYFNTPRTLVMGILNATPDSFFPQSRIASLDAGAIAELAQRMAEEGADLIDLGAESTRPGAAYLDPAEEAGRLLPALKAVRRAVDLPISVDTRHADVAEAALGAGADIVNDVSALRDDGRMADVAARAGCPVVLMHMQGDPKTMQAAPSYGDVVAEVEAFLLERAARAADRGVALCILDPGLGFGKRYRDNLELLAGLGRLASHGLPVLVGHSRKGFIGQALGRPAADGSVTPRPVDGRLAGSVAVALWSAARGARVVRVHDVAATVDALALNSILEGVHA